MLIGIDPGLANMGVYLGRTKDCLDTVHVLTTKRNKTEGQREDKLARTKQMAVELNKLMAVAALRAGDEKVTVVVEAMTWPRAAASSIMIALSWGILVAQCHRRGWDLVTVTPAQLKLAATGKKTATKEEVIAAAERAVGWLAKIKPAKKEHAADAWAATKAYEQQGQGVGAPRRARRGH